MPLTPGELRELFPFLKTRGHQRHLARLVGCHEQSICNFMTGRTQFGMGLEVRLRTLAKEIKNE